MKFATLREKWPRRDPGFIGRERLIKDLKKELSVSSQQQNQAGGDIPTTIIRLDGLGGVGKTALATEFIYVYQDQFSFISWIEEADEGLLEMDIKGLAHILGIPAAESTETTLQDLKAWLSLHPGWLLVFDNVNDFQLIQNHAPRYGGYVLTTSRRAGSISWVNKCITVSKFEHDESVNYLKRRLDEEEEETGKCWEKETEVTKLADTLGHLPLALKHAASYILEVKEGQTSIQKYIEQYEMTKGEVLNSELVDKFDVPAVLITWNITMEQIKKMNPLASEMLDVCSCIAPDNIPYELLDSIVCCSTKNPQGQVKEARAVLAKFSMLHLAPKRRTASVHTLVQLAVQLHWDSDRHLTSLRTTVQACCQAYPDKALNEGRYTSEDVWNLHSTLTTLLRNLYTSHDEKSTTGKPRVELKSLFTLLILPVT